MSALFRRINTLCEIILSFFTSKNINLQLHISSLNNSKLGRDTRSSCYLPARAHASSELCGRYLKGKGTYVHEGHEGRQGCAMAVPSGRWCLTFAFGQLRNLSFSIKVIYWTPRFHRFQALGSQPWWRKQGKGTSLLLTLRAEVSLFHGL